MLETKCKIQDVSSDSRGLDNVDMSKLQAAVIDRRYSRTVDSKRAGN
jgi:hypothetical protein